MSKKAAGKAKGSPSDLRALTADVMAQEDQLREGGGEAGRARQKKLGRLTARERIEYLLDDDSPFLEVGLWSAWNMYPEAGNVAAAGLVAGIGYVNDRAVLVSASDATVKAGAFFPATCKKVLRAQKIAMKCHLPTVYLVDSAGVYLPMQDEIFPDEDDFGRVFYNNSRMSAMGIPQYSAVMGNCVAGGAYLPVLSDKMLMTADSELYLAGPALVKAAIGQKSDAAELGGAKMHAEVSGTTDFVEENDEKCLDRLRSLIGLLPEDDFGDYESKEPEKDATSLYDIVSVDGRSEYDVRDLLKGIVDAGSMDEYKADYGKPLVCCYARLEGRPIGIVANQRHRTKTAGGEIQIGGVIYHQSADKAARFIMDCDQTGLPILFIQDVTGFMVGKASEQAGIIRSGAKLVNAVSNVRVPKITLIVGGSFGAGNYALCGKGFDPTFIFAWPNAKYAVMGGAQAASTLTQLEARKASRDGKELADNELADLRKKVEDDYAGKTDIRYGAARGWVDAIIAPHDTRQTLGMAFEVASRSLQADTQRPGFRGGVFQT